MVFQPYSPKLICFGDRIHSGKYGVHSRFDRVINFVPVTDHGTRCNNDEKTVTSVVKPEVGGGPTNIVIDDADFTCISTLEIEIYLFKLNDDEIIVPVNKIYDSQLEKGDVSKNIFERNIDTLKDTLLSKAPQKSLVFLHDDNRMNEFHSSFDKSYLQRFTSGYSQITGGKIKEGVEMIRGIGYGLTPSGDDFLAGFIAGLYLIQLFYGENTSKIRELTYDLSLSENLFSNTFLLMAKEGFFYEKLKKLCTSLMIGNGKDIEMRTTLLVDTGETSGADTLTGFLAALDRNS